MAGAQDSARKSRRKAESLRRERIVEVATLVFYERGFRNTTLDDVAERLGVTKPILYNSFASKTELLAEICARGVAAAQAELERAQALGLGPADTMRRFVPRYAAAILRAQRNIAINIREEKNLDPADAERLAALRQQFIAGIEGLLRACHDSGEIEVSDPRVAAFVLVGAVSWTTFWYNPGGVLSAEVISGRISETLLGLLRIPA
jgi:TetR/AcrR family transcriptional regulator, cholesterol catabolism regulator